MLSCHINILFWVVIAAVTACLAFLPSALRAEMRYQVGAEIAERYLSNIYLSPDNEKSDFITTPSLMGEIADETATRTLSARYLIGYNKFARYDENDYVSHLGELAWDQDLTERISWHITDRGYRSEEPAEEDPEITTTRDTRSPYIRNALETGLSYQFGPEDRLTLSFADMRLWNDDPEEEDIISYGPRAVFDYWFTHRHGVTVTGSRDYTEYDDTPSNRMNSLGLMYHLRRSPHTTWHLGYDWEDFSSRDPEEMDYVVNDWTVGIDHAWSPAWGMGLSVGYYREEPEVGSSNDGYSYTFSLSRAFVRGSFTIAGDGGHRAEFTEPVRKGEEQPGFTEYQGVSASFLYEPVRRVTCHAEAAYEHEKSTGGDSVTDDTWMAGSGLAYLFRPWLAGGVDLMYESRTSSDPDDEYDTFTALVSLTAFYGTLSNRPGALTGGGVTAGGTP